MVVIQYQSVNNKQIKISIKRNAIKLIWTVSHLLKEEKNEKDLSIHIESDEIDDNNFTTIMQHLIL
jgi:hypothetical protein